MSPRVQAEKSQIRLRTPRIPKFLSRFDLFSKALTKNDLFFDQGFFIAKGASHISGFIKNDLFFDQGFFISDLNKLFRPIRIFVFKIGTDKELIPQYYICFPTSVF